MIYAGFAEVACVCVDAGYRSAFCLLSLSPPLSFPLSPSHQVVLFEVELQDGVFDSSKDEADVLCVSCACEMGVDDLVTVWVQVHKHLQDELSTCLCVPLGTWGRGNIRLHFTSIQNHIRSSWPVLSQLYLLMLFMLKYIFVEQKY